MGDKRDISVVEVVAVNAANEGKVSEILETLGTEGVPEAVKAKVMEALPEAVRNATKNDLLSEAIEVIGAEGVPEAVQMEAVGIITKEKAGSWLGGLIGMRQGIPEAVQMKIVDVLAEGGWVSEVLDIIGAGNVSDAVHNKARLALPKALDVGGEDRIRELTMEEKIKAFGVLTRLLLPRENPLQKDGVLSGGTVKRPVSAGKDAKAPKKGLTNGS